MTVVFDDEAVAIVKVQSVAVIVVAAAAECLVNVVDNVIGSSTVLLYMMLF